MLGKGVIFCFREVLGTCGSSRPLPSPLNRQRKILYRCQLVQASTFFVAYNIYIHCTVLCKTGTNAFEIASVGRSNLCAHYGNIHAEASQPPDVAT